MDLLVRIHVSVWPCLFPYTDGICQIIQIKNFVLIKVKQYYKNLIFRALVKTKECHNPFTPLELLLAVSPVMFRIVTVLQRDRKVILYVQGSITNKNCLDPDIPPIVLKSAALQALCFLPSLLDSRWTFFFLRIRTCPNLTFRKELFFKCTLYKCLVNPWIKLFRILYVEPVCLCFVVRSRR